MDILDYQVQNQSRDIEKSQLKTILDTYFKDVPTELPEGDELLNLQLTTLDIYGTHTVKVAEIYNGNLKNNEQEMISFKIKIWEAHEGYHETYDLQCERGTTWAEWATKGGEPIYNPFDYGENSCGIFHGSLQELILSLEDDDYIEYERQDTYTELHIDDGPFVKTSDAILSVEDGGTYRLVCYYDGS